MAMGKRKGKQPPLWISFKEMQAPGHPFYRKLNDILREAHFDDEVELLCAPYYKEEGRPGIPPGVYFRMLFVGYFEGIDSQRGIAWRCADSLSLREFLGLGLEDKSPDHSSLTRVRQRLPLEVHQDVFRMVLGLAIDRKLLHGKTIAVDSTNLEANAAMKSIVRKGTKEDYTQYVRRLAEKEGIEEPTDEALRRFDRHRPGKTLSNEDWKSPTDPDSRIVRMKDGRTRLGYKAEHAVDLESDLVVAAEVYGGDEPDAQTLVETVERAEEHLNVTGRRKTIVIEEVAADKGYYSTENLVELRKSGKRTYIPEADRPHGRRWKGRSSEERRVVYENRRRVRRPRGRRLQRQRSELAERTFAHVCDTGGGRRVWVRGRDEIAKVHVLRAAARNLGRILRSICGIGKPKGLQGLVSALLASFRALMAALTLLRLRSRRAFVRMERSLRFRSRTETTT